MKRFYEPDSRWEMHQINNNEDYAKKLVITGYFHDQVPEDVIKAYETVEYLMAHAYYYWPMFDEAFNKMLFTIEMGIKLKAKQLNIPIYRRKENGERWYRRLSLIIDDICDEDYLRDLKKKLERSAGLRDMKAHPKQNSFSGPSGGTHRNIKYCINILNRLFRGREWHKQQQKKIVKAKESITNLKNELLVVESGERGEVIRSILDFDIIDEALFVVCLPVLDVRKLEAKSNQFPHLKSFSILDYQFLNDKVIGRTLDGNDIKISLTNDKEVRNAYSRFKKYLKEIPEEEMKINLNINAIETPWFLSNAEYQYLNESDFFSKYS
ncbi:hypothetical protein [Aliifodinibius salipaludis]|nr:hypothetical protein [Aliifodinibius salipaludis]